MRFTDTLKELEAKATEGPWELELVKHSDCQHICGEVWAKEDGDDYQIVHEQFNSYNAELIAYLRNHAKKIISLVEAAENMRDCKGRYHTEQATNRVFEALAALNKDQS